jgi:hypothetical protein
MSRKRSTRRKPLTYGARAKRRSEGQRVGTKGELIFESWAVDQSLVPNRCPEDFGFDYFCQVLQPVRGGSEEISG